jgi:ADP-ribose pyrophosphatase YjhB (NUDIX family)
MKKNIVDLLDEIRSIAQLGLTYSKDSYDIQRYERLLGLCSDEYSNITGINSKMIEERFNKELGYVTPKVRVNGIVFLDDGRLLLERRSDDNLWGIPGGWAEVGESSEESVRRELLEETGLSVDVKELINVYSRMPRDFGNAHTSYHILYRCEINGGQLMKSEESLEVGFYTIEDINEWHTDHRKWAIETYINILKARLSAHPITPHSRIGAYAPRVQPSRKGYDWKAVHHILSD